MLQITVYLNKRFPWNFRFFTVKCAAFTNITKSEFNDEYFDQLSSLQNPFKPLKSLQLTNSPQ